MTRSRRRFKYEQIGRLKMELEWLKKKLIEETSDD